MDWLIDWLSRFAQWLLDALLWVPQKLYELVLAGLAIVVNAIPVPAWLSGADPFAVIHPHVVYFADAMEIGFGLTVVLSAYVLRFIIRRIPLIG